MKTNLIRKWKKHGEVRLNDDSSIDEIVLFNVETFHLEQMDEGSWWIGLNFKNGDMMHVRLFNKRNRPVKVNCETDDNKISEGFNPR